MVQLVESYLKQSVVVRLCDIVHCGDVFSEEFRNELRVHLDPLVIMVGYCCGVYLIERIELIQLFVLRFRGLHHIAIMVDCQLL